VNRPLDASHPASRSIAPTSAAPELRVDFVASADALLRFSFADPGNAVRVHCERLGGPSEAECWHANAGYRALVLTQSERGGDIAEAARKAYAELISRVRGSSHP
jgi:hypothetical protein